MAKLRTVPKLRPIEPICGAGENCCPDTLIIWLREPNVERIPIGGPTVKLRWAITLPCLAANRLPILGPVNPTLLPPAELRVALSTEGL